MSEENQSIVNIHDRVTEAYYGKMGQEFMRETQARIHWICAQVFGDNVLDIGCSQGIVPVLLARDGVKVVGIDTSSKAMEEAKSFVLNEPEHVQEKISFINADFLSHQFKDLKFDTVVMSEVLEHLVRPERFIDAADKLLSENGKVIITVPFGINDFIDHKHTFYLLGPLKLISQKFEVEKIQVLGKWIGIVATINKKKNTNALTGLILSERDIEQLESGFFIIERSLRDNLAATKKKLEDANLRYRTSTDQVSLLRNKFAQEESIRKNSEQNIVHVSAQLQEAEIRLKEESSKLQDEKFRAHEFDKKLAQRDSELEIIRNRLGDAGFEHKRLQDLIADLKEKLNKEESIRKNTEQNIVNTSLHLQEIEKRLKEESSKLQDEKFRAFEFDKKLVQRDSELEIIRNRLGDANLEHQRFWELIADLNEKLRKEELNRIDLSEKLRKEELNRIDLSEKLRKEELNRINAEQTLAQSFSKNQSIQKRLNEEIEKKTRLEVAFKSINSRASTLEGQLATSRNKIEKIKLTLSFRLGHALIFASKSWSGLKALPIVLWSLRKEAIQKKRKPDNYNFSSEKKLQATFNDNGDSSEVSLNGEGWTCVNDSNEEFIQKNILEGEHFIVSGKIYGNVNKEENNSALINIRFFDSKGNLLPCNEKIGLSKSEKTGYFRYLNLSSQAREFFVDFDAPKQSEFFVCRIVPWGRKKKIYIKDIVISHKNTIKKRDVISHQPPLLPLTSKTIKSELIKSTSIKGWPELLPDKRKPIVLGIMDEFTSSCFSHDCSLIQPRPDNWLALIDKYNPDFIFIESAWKGNSGSWQYRVAEYSYQPGCEVKEVSMYAKEKGIPVVFWNKEDPVHHSKFLKTASFADLVLTTDANMIPSYVKKIGLSKVAVLPFAAQTALHRPRSILNRKLKTCFAGSWYGERHKQRGEDMKWLLSAAAPLGLDIYDRNFGTNNFMFPESLRTHVVGSLSYNDLCSEYGGYRLFVNVNSVTDSPTMFSRRVFELLACGTPVISTYSDGIKNFFGDDIVTFVKSEAEAQEAIQILMTDDALWRKKSLAGIRAVHSSNTYRHRIKTIMELLGLTRSLPDPNVLLFAKVSTYEDATKFLDLIASQTYKNISGFALVDDDSSLVNLSIPSVRLSDLIEDKFENSIQEFDFVGFVDLNKNYFATDYEDLINATRYAPESKVWGKSKDPKNEFAHGLLVEHWNSIYKWNEFFKNKSSYFQGIPISNEVFGIQRHI